MPSFFAVLRLSCFLNRVSFSRTAGALSTTRTMTTTALYAGSALDCTLNLNRVVVKNWMTYAPKMEPAILNLPPLSALPPSATAKMASISMSFATTE